MKKIVFIFTMFCFTVTACKATKIVTIKSNLIDCAGVGKQKCMQYKENGDNHWKLFYGSIEGFAYEEGYEYDLEVVIDKVANPPADDSGLKYRLKNVIRKEQNALMAVKTTDKIKSSLITKSQEDLTPLVIYDSSSRGYYFNLAVYNEGHMTFTNQRNVSPDTKAISKADMNDLIKLISSIDLNNIATLESPTNKRQYDGAPFTSVTIYKGKEKYQSSIFDGGYPPAELEALVNKILSLQPKRKNNDN